MITQESFEGSVIHNHYESIEDATPSLPPSDPIDVTLSLGNKKKQRLTTGGSRENLTSVSNPIDRVLDEKFQKFQQRLMTPSKFPFNTHHVDIHYAEEKELFHAPEHLLPMIPEESVIEIECLAMAAFPTVVGSLPEDVRVATVLPFQSGKTEKRRYPSDEVFYDCEETYGFRNTVQAAKTSLVIKQNDDQLFGMCTQVMI